MGCGTDGRTDGVKPIYIFFYHYHHCACWWPSTVMTKFRSRVYMGLILHDLKHWGSETSAKWFTWCRRHFQMLFFKKIIFAFLWKFHWNSVFYLSDCANRCYVPHSQVINTPVNIKHQVNCLMVFCKNIYTYRQVSNIRRTLTGN